MRSSRALGALVALAGLACSPSAPVGKNAMLVDVAAEIGLDFRYENGRSGHLFFIEIAGGGAALLDYDNDGDLDVYLVQGAPIDVPDSAPPTIGHRQELRDRLFRNDLEVSDGGERRMRFVDVTEESGIRALGYGMGVAAGDVDNDGFVDLYVTNYGSNQLWRNRGPDATGRYTFEEVTASAAADDKRWSTSATFFDFDRDGWLDLYVTNYVAYQLGERRTCTSAGGRPDYCGPQNYKGESDRLLRNLGDGTFEDITGAAGMLSEHGSGLGVVSADFDGDGWQDLYVANDLMPNVLWRNLGGEGKLGFRNDALLAGCAVNLEGDAEASMGVEAADFDADGDLDLFMTHLDGETHTLYVNDGRGSFSDHTVLAGLGASSLPFTGFGTGAFDVDGDGWLDLVVANGAVRLIETQLRDGEDFPLRQRNQLLLNLGNQVADASPVAFRDAGEAGGEPFTVAEVSRGVALGDVDNDGATDVLVVNNEGPARLLLNQVQDHRWLGLRVLGAEGRRYRLGALVEVELDDGRKLVRRVRRDGSYCSSHDPRVLIGLGNAAVTRVRVDWPEGGVEEWTDLTLDAYTTLRQGSGRVVGDSGP